MSKSEIIMKNIDNIRIPQINIQRQRSLWCPTIIIGGM